MNRILIRNPSVMVVGMPAIVLVPNFYLKGRRRKKILFIFFFSWEKRREVKQLRIASRGVGSSSRPWDSGLKNLLCTLGRFVSALVGFRISKRTRGTNGEKQNILIIFMTLLIYSKNSTLSSYKRREGISRTRIKDLTNS